MKSTFVKENGSDVRYAIALTLALLTVLSMVAIASASPSYADDTAMSGTCGTNLIWELTENADAPGTYTLSISGTGDMEDYHHTDLGFSDGKTDVEPPWGDYKYDITDIVLQDGITHIGSYAFYGTGITSIDIPDTVETIGASAFWFCTSLESVSIPASVSSIEKGTFNTCRALTNIEFDDPTSILSIGASAFAATGLKTLDLSELTSLTEIKDGAFQRSPSLTSVTLPASLESVGFETFNSCSVLETVNIPAGSMLKTLDEKAFNDSAIQSIDLSNATELATIGPNAFGSCDSLSSVTLPKNFEGNADGAFIGSDNLTSVKIGDQTFEISSEGGIAISPVYFNTNVIIVLTSTYVMEPVLSENATVTGYNSSNPAFAVTEEGIVTIAPSDSVINTTITVKATYNSTEYTADVTLTYLGAQNFNVTCEDSDVNLVASGIEKDDLSSTQISMMDGIQYPGDYVESGEEILIDVDRQDDSTEGVTFRFNVGQIPLSGLSVFVVHFGESELDYPTSTVGDGYIEIDAESFSPFLIVLYVPEDGSDPGPEPTPDPEPTPGYDDEDLPPFIPAQPKDSGDDVTIVACAAAAVVAALMAVFLIVSYKMD